MIHEDLEGEALKAEVLRVARSGSVYDLDVEMTAAGQKEGVEIAWLGKRQTEAGDEIVFRFFAPCASDRPLAHIHQRPASEAKLRRMAQSCDVLVKDIAWHPHSDSGVLTILWDSVIPMGSEPLGPRRMSDIQRALETSDGVSEETVNFYRRYGA